MAAPKQSYPEFIYINFHLTNDSTYRNQHREVDNRMTEVFDEYAVLEHVGQADGEQEFEHVYRILTPSEDKMPEFFESLKELFEATQRFLPSFTQGVSVKGDDSL